MKLLDKEKCKGLAKLFAEAIKAVIIKNPLAWVKENVISSESAVSPNLDLELTPYLKEPFFAMVSRPDIRKVNLQAPVGSGKSTLFVALLNYYVCNDPGNAMVTFQNETEAKNFAESRLFPTFNSNKEMQHLLPKQSKNARKMKMLFPHMDLYITSATLGQLQSKSIRFLIGDEVWLWEKGMISEFLRRQHDRYNAKIFLCSQGGDAGTDWVDEYNRGNIRHYAYECPNCGKFCQYDFRDLKYTWGKMEVSAEEFKKSVHLLTPCCKHKIEDTIINRRKLSESGKYLPANNKNARPNELSFNFNALSCYRVEWSQLAYEWNEANQKKANGDRGAIVQFLQKRLAQNNSKIEDLCEGFNLQRVTSSMEDLRAQKYICKVMGIDVQKDHYWFTIYGFEECGTMNLLDCGRLNTERDILEKMKEYDVLPHQVILDDAYDTDNVKLLAGQNRFITMNGTKKEYYRNSIDGKMVEQVHSPRELSITQGVRSLGYKFSSQRAKDILHARLNLGKFQIPIDTPREYFQQMQNEYIEEYKNTKTNKLERKWKAKNERNNSHMLDCTLMCLIYGIICRIIREVKTIPIQE